MPRFEQFMFPAMVISLGLFVLSMCSFVIYAIYIDAKLTSDFRGGKISIEEYCDKATNGGTTEYVPVVCYPIYEVSQTGVRKECNYNAAVKMVQCHDVPILEPNKN